MTDGSQVGRSQDQRLLFKLRMEQFLECLMEPEAESGGQSAIGATHKLLENHLFAEFVSLTDRRIDKAIQLDRFEWTRFRSETSGLVVLYTMMPLLLHCGCVQSLEVTSAILKIGKACRRSRRRRLSRPS